MEADISNIIKNLNTFKVSAESFKTAANESNRKFSLITKDLSRHFMTQNNHNEGIKQAINDNSSSTALVAQKIDQSNVLAQQSVVLQTTMVEHLKNLAKAVKDSNDKENLSHLPATMGAPKGMLSKAAATAGLAGVLGTATVGGWGMNKAFDALPHPKGPADYDPGNNANLGVMGRLRYMKKRYIDGDEEEDFFRRQPRNRPTTNYSANEEAAKSAADRYLGRSLSSDEWRELKNATHAEAGHKDQTELAMVMASILNRVRESNSTVQRELRKPNQFQAVTGTRFDPNPSRNFVEGPGEKRAEQIYGATANILERVSKEQKNFTAASRAAYGPGTNIGYRNNMLRNGGSIVGGSVFNTAPPELPKQDYNKGDAAAAAKSPLVENVNKTFKLGGGITGTQAHVEKLNSDLQAALSGALEEYFEKTGKRAVITSAHRTPEEHERIDSGGRPKARGYSKHFDGDAVDIKGEYADEMDELGILRKHGLHRPVRGDEVHIELINKPQRRTAGPKEEEEPEKPKPVSSPEKIRGDFKPMTIGKSMAPVGPKVAETIKRQTIEKEVEETVTNKATAQLAMSSSQPSSTDMPTQTPNPEVNRVLEDYNSNSDGAVTKPWAAKLGINFENEFSNIKLFA